MGVPQIHAGQRAVQRQIGLRDFVDALGVRCAQALLHTAVTVPHCSLLLADEAPIIPAAPPYSSSTSGNTSRQTPPTKSRTAANSASGTTRPPSSSASSWTR